ncbi:hypothetical protein LY78DRAFT_373463 [Colletotrichum sublineola]|nr:hypothetical protein LY78DRAFT_373463 [Colletotrichum sublineola]
MVYAASRRWSHASRHNSRTRRFIRDTSQSVEKRPSFASPKTTQKRRSSRCWKPSSTSSHSSNGRCPTDANPTRSCGASF